jgi:hypothetical protein
VSTSTVCCGPWSVVHGLWSKLQGCQAARQAYSTLQSSLRLEVNIVRTRPRRTRLIKFTETPCIAPSKYFNLQGTSFRQQPGQNHPLILRSLRSTCGRTRSSVRSTPHDMKHDTFIDPHLTKSDLLVLKNLLLDVDQRIHPHVIDQKQTARRQNGVAISNGRKYLC